MKQKYSVLLLGVGSMGGSILSCWLDQCLLDSGRSAVVDPAPVDAMAQKIEAYGLPLNPEQDQAYDVCVLAVKPQLLPAVIPTLEWPDIDKTLFMSVAAGKSVRTIRNHLKEIAAGEAPVVRVMPNLPVSVQKGISILYTDEKIESRQRKIATDLFAATGKAIWVEAEEQIDSGMSVSSCGPAYVFLLTEAMTEAGVAAGLPNEMAEMLARETVIGAGAMMAAETRDAGTLRAAVTSKGGTTAEALKILDGPQALRPLMQQAVAAATLRAQQLSD